MLIIHKLSLDLINPGIPERIQVKQGDTLARTMEIQLFANGEAWLIPAGVTPLVRWAASDPDTGNSASGIFDTLPSGANAWNYAQNQLDLVLVPQMFALPGLVQADVAMVQGNKVLATFNFEFYVNRAPANGTEPKAQNYYKVATLDQLNAQLIHLETLITELREDHESNIAQLEERMEGLEQIVRDM